MESSVKKQGPTNCKMWGLKYVFNEVQVQEIKQTSPGDATVRLLNLDVRLLA